MSLYLYIVFGLIALFRVTVLLISKNNEKKLILTLRYKEKPSNGDRLQLWLHANSGSGVVYVRY